jgi:hypothetical protein
MMASRKILDMTINEPNVIDPPGFSNKAAWDECKEYVDKCGGVVDEDGEVNWRAAHGADPGVCTCPNCKEYFWAWGRKHLCTCGFEYPTDWWSMYSWGVSAAKTEGRYKHEERMDHPYYRYGFENPVDDAWAEHNRIPWKKVLGRE